MKFEFRASAQRELLDATTWYRQDGGPAVAEQFEWAVQRALQVLVFMPQVGTPSYPNVRLWPVKGFPYTLVYRVQGEVLTVVAVAHQSRKPGYWRRPS